MSPEQALGGEGERHLGLFTTQKTPLFKVDIEFSRNQRVYIAQAAASRQQHNSISDFKLQPSKPGFSFPSHPLENTQRNKSGKVGKRNIQEAYLFATND